MPPSITFSYSKLATYSTCPAAFRMKYLESGGAYVSETEDLSFGKACHNALKEYDDRLKLKLRSRDTRFLKKNIPKWFSSVPGLPIERYEEFYQLLINHSRFRKVNPKEIHATDLKLAIDRDGISCDPGSPSARLVGILDRLDLSDSGKRARIVDYKSSRFLSANPIQLLIYAVLVSSHFPDVTSFEMEFDYIRYGFQKAAFSKRGLPVARRKPSIQRFWGLIQTLMERAESDTSHTPNVGSACTTCPFISKCPAKPLLPLEIQNGAHAERVANGILLLERDIKALRSSLKHFISVNGPVRTGDVVFDVSIFQKFSADVVPMIVKYKELGFKTSQLEDLVKLNTDGLKALIKTDRNLAEALSPYIYGSGEEHLTHKIVEKTIPEEVMSVIADKEDNNENQSAA